MPTATNRAEQQAHAQMESIHEMLDALDRGKAAARYAQDLTRKKCKALLKEAGIQTYDSETLEELQAAVAENIADDSLEPDDFEFDEDAARDRIHEDPLSVRVRSGWANNASEFYAEEFEILLCTGGPAVRIIGSLDSGEPDKATLQYQDWFTPWESVYLEEADSDALLQYCQVFYFGE